MSKFSQPRLEGRALEHAVANDSGHRIRMASDRTGSFEWVGGEEAREIRLRMAGRVVELRQEMEAQGLHIKDADCPVRVSQVQRSIDVRLWSSAHQANAVVEVKWTRRALDVAMTWGRKSLPMLRQACAGGRWVRSRREVCASVVGVLVVKPSTWSCILYNAKGSGGRMEFPRATLATPMKRASGRSQSGAQKRKGNAGRQDAERKWRKGVRGKLVKAKSERQYRNSPKGKRAISKWNVKHYNKNK